VVLDQLFSEVLEILSRERSLNPQGHFDGSTPVPTLAQLGLELHTAEPDVATVAALATRAAVRLLLGYRLDVPAEELGSDLHLTYDLGADSLTRVDLVLLLEEALEVSVPDDSMSLVQSIGDAELFSVLFDRTREEIILTLGEAASELALDTPLEQFGDHDGRVAVAAAARAVGSELPSSKCCFSTL